MDFYCYFKERFTWGSNPYDAVKGCREIVDELISNPAIPDRISTEASIGFLTAARDFAAVRKTFEGTITLQEEKGVYEAARQKGAAGQDTKEPLDEIIEKINEKYKGAFTEGDRVLLNALHTKLMANKKLASMAKTSDPQIFAESIFPKAFGDAAQDSYMEAQDTYTSLFEDQAKYNAIMRALAEVIYRELRGE